MHANADSTRPSNFPRPAPAAGSAVRAAVGALLGRGVTALVLHCDDGAHQAVLDELAARDLLIPTDVAVISVGSTFDTTTMHPPLDVVPLVPQASCDRAVDLAMQLLSETAPAPGVYLIAPEYRAHGSVAPPDAPR